MNKPRREGPKYSASSCKRFRKYVDSGEFQQAMDTVRHDPELVSYMTLDEIPLYYAFVLRALGNKQAQDFKNAVRENIRTMERELHSAVPFVQALKRVARKYEQGRT